MRRDEAGSATIEFIAGVGLFLLVATGLYVVTAWPARLNAATAAAYEAARAVVEAPTVAQGEATGRQRAAEVWANHGFDGTVEVSYTTGARGEYVRATVSIVLPALRFPGVGEWDAVGWSKSSTQLVPQYRSYS